jgi:hypothetical protein
MSQNPGLPELSYAANEAVSWLRQVGAAFRDRLASPELWMLGNEP